MLNSKIRALSLNSKQNKNDNFVAKILIISKSCCVFDRRHNITFSNVKLEVSKHSMTNDRKKI